MKKILKLFVMVIIVAISCTMISWKKQSTTTATDKPKITTSQEQSSASRKTNNSLQPQNEVFTNVDQMPQFFGGDAGLMNFIASHMIYPPTAQEQGIQGKCVVQFVVTKTGDIGEVKVVRPLSPDCDAEIIRIVKMLPKFTPGKQNGQPVNVWYSLPVTFKLQGDKENTNNNSTSPKEATNEQNYKTTDNKVTALENSVIPNVPSPLRMVVDYTGVLSSNFCDQLDQLLKAYSMQTNNQICVVVVDDLKDLSISHYAQALGNKWGVGQADKNNGVVVLIKTKTAQSKGEIFIATGSGLESILPDSECERVIDECMIKHLRQDNNYENAIRDGVNEIIQSIAKARCINYTNFKRQ